MNESDCREMVLRDLHERKSMPIGEYLLHQKWEEVNAKYPRTENVLFGDRTYLNRNHALLIPRLQRKLWDGTDILRVRPRLVLSTDSSEEWTALRVLIHTQQHSGAIGRCLNFFVVDDTTSKYLGLISVASDFLDLRCRDEEIGWTREQRTFDQRVKHTAICSTIVPVQPFGYNYVGGKLLSLLALSDDVARLWEQTYGSLLAGMTTTSLYGSTKSMSQYDNLRYWKRMGLSSGSSPIRMSESVRSRAYEWAKTNLPQVYEKYVLQSDGKVRDRQNRFLVNLYARLKISTQDYRSDHLRGVYFARRYINSDPFLRNEISQDQLVPLSADLSVEALTDLWKTKYGQKRFDSLESQGRVSREALFYADMSDMTWTEARDRYLASAGR